MLIQAYAVFSVTEHWSLCGALLSEKLLIESCVVKNFDWDPQGREMTLLTHMLHYPPPSLITTQSQQTWR